MEFPEDLLFTKDHEWARKTSESTIVIGITTFAVDQLGDITIVELPAVGDAVTAGEVFGTVESVKAVSDLYAPASGTVVKVNENLNDIPELVNDSPYDKGWMLEIKLDDADALSELLDQAAYTKLTADA